jgi:hypothetical protein
MASLRFGFGRLKEEFAQVDFGDARLTARLLLTSDLDSYLAEGHAMGELYPRTHPAFKCSTKDRSIFHTHSRAFYISH